MKLLIFFFTILSLFTSTILFSQEWGTTNAINGGRYDDIYFLNSDTGWTVNAIGQILHTVDKGNSWTIQHESSDYFRAIDFINDQIGFAGTLSESLWKTEDGGNTWIDIQDLLPVSVPGICGLSHAGDYVYGVGFFDYPAYFIKSKDQGQTWTYTDLSEFADGMVECHFLDTNIGFISGIKENSGGIVLKTIDGGENWTQVLDTEGGSEYVWKLDFVTEDIVYGSIESFTGNTSRIIKSIDGGNTWTIHVVDTQPLDLQGIGFISVDTGWVGPRHKPMYETTDGGLTWNENPDLYQNLNRFFRINSEEMYGSGSYIHRYGEWNVSSLEEFNYDHAHTISKISPNPFFNALKFHLTIDNSTNARLDFYSTNGQLIQTFYSGNITAGNYDYQLESKHLNALQNGTYFIVLRTNEGFISVPVIKAGNQN